MRRKDMMDDLGFPARLRAIRAYRGLSQKALARSVGFDHSAISRLEGGSREPSIRTLARLADALDCAATDLLRDNERASIWDEVEREEQAA
jgi:transcriptional regulator with XRE-family HTH domain